jgi:DNA end-binding protein Ku
MAATVWKGHISFGMVAFPVRLHAAARSRKISFHLLHKCDRARVRHVLYCKAEDRRVSRADLVKGFEYDRDRYVVIEEQDLARVEPRTARLMEVLEFVPAAEVDPVYLDASWYVLPEAAGKRPYILLFEALRQSGYVAMAQWTAQNREHMVMLRPGRHGLILHTLFYADEVRTADEFHAESDREGAAIPPRERELAGLLIHALAGAFRPEQYRDRYRENLRALIEARIQAEKIAPEDPAPMRGPVPDLMQALKASLARRRNPLTAVSAAARTLDSSNTAAPCHKPRKRA